MHKLTSEQIILHEKAMNDCNVLEVHLYGLIKFLADSRTNPKRIIEVNEALEKIQNLRRNLESDIRWAKEK